MGYIYIYHSTISYHTIIPLLYRTIPYHTTPQHTIQCRTISCHTIPHRTIPYHTIPHLIRPYSTIPYNTIPYCTAPHLNIPYHTVPYHITPHLTIPYSAVPYHAIWYRTLPYSTTSLIILKVLKDLSYQLYIQFSVDIRRLGVLNRSMNVAVFKAESCSCGEQEKKFLSLLHTKVKHADIYIVCHKCHKCWSCVPQGWDFPGTSEQSIRV